VDRAEIGGWLSGPPTTPLAPGEHRGSRFGLPEDGPGSIAGFGRRIPAVFIDWFVALFVGRLIAPGVEYPGNGSGFVTLGTFAFMTWLLTWLGGGSFGHRLLGLRVIRVDGAAPGPWRAAIRTLLLCLVIPAAFWDSDGRGLHDKAAGTVLVRLR
jgi:uncharacterized RDD family membrane protein YckC